MFACPPKNIVVFIGTRDDDTQSMPDVRRE